MLMPLACWAGGTILDMRFTPHTTGSWESQTPVLPSATSIPNQFTDNIDLETPTTFCQGWSRPKADLKNAELGQALCRHFGMSPSQKSTRNKSSLCYWSSFLLMYIMGSNKWWSVDLASCGRSGWDSWLLALASPSPGCCGHMGNEPVTRPFPSPISPSSSLSSLCPAPPPPLPLPYFLSLCFSNK